MVIVIFLMETIKKDRRMFKIHKWNFPKNHPYRHVEIMQHTPTGHSAFENEVYYPKKKMAKKSKRL